MASDRVQIATLLAAQMIPVHLNPCSCTIEPERRNVLAAEALALADALLTLAEPAGACDHDQAQLDAYRIVEHEGVDWTVDLVGKLAPYRARDLRAAHQLVTLVRLADGQQLDRDLAIVGVEEPADVGDLSITTVRLKKVNVRHG